ncbi:MAG: Uma2 family endonuclease [Chloroflexia bacterium]
MATHTQFLDVTTDRRRRWTVDDYHKMIEAGILDEWDKVELIGGEVVEMSAKGRRHSWSLMALNQALQAQLLPEVVVVDSQNPLILTDDSEPEPDVVVLRALSVSARDGCGRGLARRSVGLLLRFDREVKLLDTRGRACLRCGSWT